MKIIEERDETKLSGRIQILVWGPLRFRVDTLIMIAALGFMMATWYAVMR